MKNIPLVYRQTGKAMLYCMELKSGQCPERRSAMIINLVYQNSNIVLRAMNTGAENHHSCADGENQRIIVAL